VRLAGSDELQARFGSRLSSIVEVTLRDGTTIARQEVDALGGPEKPASVEDRLRKAAEVIAEAPNPAAGATLVEAARSLADAGSLQPLANAFRDLSRWAG
jgi:hypothetical protein